VLSGLPGANLMILGTIVFVSLGSVLHDPLAMGRAAVLMTPPVIVTGTIYDFLIFPNISDYPLFIISLSPVVVMTCWLIKTGKGPMGIFYGVQSVSLLSPANVQTLDPTAFVDTTAFLVAGSVCIFFSLLLIVPVDPACVVFVWLWLWGVPCATSWLTRTVSINPERAFIMIA
jgi:hypothetical protein